MFFEYVEESVKILSCREHQNLSSEIMLMFMIWTKFTAILDKTFVQNIYNLGCF